MTENCRVEKINKSTAYVSLSSPKKCGGCKACAFGRSNKVTMPALMQVECKVGDEVLVQMPAKEAPAAALLIYLVPLVLMAVGFIVGGLLGDIYRVIFAFALVALSIIPCFFIEKSFRKKTEYQAVVIKILPKDSDEKPLLCQT